MSSCSDYEEDFVVDDEGSADDAEAIEKKSSSPFTETQSEIKDGDTSGTEDDENDGGWIFFSFHLLENKPTLFHIFFSYYVRTYFPFFIFVAQT